MVLSQHSTQRTSSRLRLFQHSVFPADDSFGPKKRGDIGSESQNLHQSEAFLLLRTKGRNLRRAKLGFDFKTTIPQNNAAKNNVFEHVQIVIIYHHSVIIEPFHTESYISFHTLGAVSLGNSFYPRVPIMLS